MNHINPMFTRRNRSIAISSQQHNSTPKPTLIASARSNTEESSSGVDRLSPDSPDGGPLNLNNFDLGRRSEGEEGHSNSSSCNKSSRNVSLSPNRKILQSGSSSSSSNRISKISCPAATLAQNLLASKQNMLAQVSLTPEENLERQGSSSVESDDGGSFLVTNKDPAKSERSAQQQQQQQQRQGDQMLLRDIEDEDFHFEESAGDNFGGGRQPFGNGNTLQSEVQFKNSGGKRFSEGRPQLKIMDTQTYRELKIATVGPNGSFQEGWVQQAFSFDCQIPYGLVQKRGGPCGVLAVVQALVLRNLMFGTPYCEDDDLPLPDPSVMFNQSDPLSLRMLNYRKNKALVCALTEILWRCANVGTKAVDLETPSTSWSDLLSIAREEKELKPAAVCFSSASIGAEFRTFDQISHLKNYIHVNLQKFDCVSLVYSAVLSRGIDNVQEDLDFPNCPLIVSHGYCSQELVNLLTIGKAISNVFDNQVSLDEKILKGIESRSDIGLLSLFEHYDSCRVGSFLKSPRFPLWIVCSESHFSLLFSPNMGIIQDPGVDKFELYYYDGLARQQNHIKLSIELNNIGGRGRSHGATRAGESLRIQPGSSSASFNNNNNNNNDGDDEELIPPIDKCIRTKWRNAHVDWNETEPIL